MSALLGKQARWAGGSRVQPSLNPTPRHAGCPRSPRARNWRAESLTRLPPKAPGAGPALEADPITGTSPKSPSGHTNARAHLRGRVPRLGGRRLRSDRRPRPRDSLVAFVPADFDCARSCSAFCATGDWKRLKRRRRRCRVFGPSPHSAPFDCASSYVSGWCGRLRRRSAIFAYRGRPHRLLCHIWLRRLLGE